MDRCRGLPVLVVNDNYRIAPWATWLYAADRSWWDVHHKRVRDTFQGERWTCDRTAAREYGLNRVECVASLGLSADPAKVHSGMNSGYQAINLALHFGATRVLLLGYDLKITGKRHWFGDHKGTDKRGRPLRNNNPGDFTPWIRHFDFMDPASVGLEVINCSRDTALTCFPRMGLDEGLRRATA